MVTHSDFHCGCTGGETQVIDENTVKHCCGFHPSSSGDLGIWFFYHRVQVNLLLTGGVVKYTWYRIWV